MTIDKTPWYSPRPNHFITDTHTLGWTASNWAGAVDRAGDATAHLAAPHPDL